MYKNLSAPLVVQLEITERCPNRCFHCYNYWRHTENSSVSAALLNNAQIDHIMDELERANVFGVVITGGEPFLNKQGMFQILNRIEKRGFMSAAINSSLIGMEINDVERLASYQCVDNILVSVMGPSPEVHDYISNQPGSFHNTLRGIEMLDRYRIPVFTNMVISRLNKDFIRETAVLCKSLGVKIFNATRATAPLGCSDFHLYALNLTELRESLIALSDVGRAENISVGALTVYPLCGVRDVYENPMTARKRCSAGITVAAISAKGEVRACTHLQECAGNIFEESMASIWERMISWRDGSYLPLHCKDCRALPICGGGCRADAQATHGSLCGDDPLISKEDTDIAVEQYQLLMREIQIETRLPITFTINPMIRWRSESFGSICFLNGKCAGIFNKETTELIFSELAENTYAFEELLKIVPLKFIQDLYRKRIII